MYVFDPRIVRPYDIRGIYHESNVGVIDEKVVYALAQAYVRVFPPEQSPAAQKAVVLGRDVRDTSAALHQAALDGLTEAGVDVVDIGVISTDMLYFTVAAYDYAGGIILSASHNPKEFAGLKLVREKAIPISEDSGLRDIGLEAWRRGRVLASQKGKVESRDIVDDYVRKVRSFLGGIEIRPFKVVLNANCGLAGKVGEQVLEGLPVTIVERLYWEPDGSFPVPDGRPDPLWRPNRRQMEEAVKRHGGEALGVAWDADADRCFFFTEKGEFVPPYFMTVLLSRYLLRHAPADSTRIVIHDPRLVWAVQDKVREAGGTPLVNKCGHAFFKEAMRKHDALFAGEASAHYYFRDFYYCDNGLVPFLLMLALLSEEDKTLTEMVAPLRAQYAVADEINLVVENHWGKIEEVQDYFLRQRQHDARLDEFDGVDGLSVTSVEERAWRFNLRPSNTESLLRLNVESTSGPKMVQRVVGELLELIQPQEIVQ